MRRVLIAFCAHRSLLGAAQALEGQGLPVPAAELRAQGVGLRRSLGRKTRDFGGERSTRIGMYSMQSGYTQGNVYECPRARGRRFFNYYVLSLSQPVLSAMLSKKSPLHAREICRGL